MALSDPPDERKSCIREVLSQVEVGLADFPVDRLHQILRPCCEHLIWVSDIDSSAVEEDLGRLEQLITVDALDRDRLGSTAARLGQHIAAATGSIRDRETAHLTARLGDLLFHAGHALRGPTPSNIRTSS